MSAPLLDRYSILHGAFGVACRVAGLSPLTTIALAIGWEIVEDGLKDRVRWAFPDTTHDRWPMQLGDVAITMACYFGAAAIR